MLVFVATIAALAQDVKAAKFDPRLSVHTILREDIFAGFMANDAGGLARGEQNLLRLIAERPADQATLLAWKGTIAMTRGAWAHEAHREAESAELVRGAVALFNQAEQLDPQSVGVLAVVGGSCASLAERLPQPARSEAWAAAYRAYQALWARQASAVNDLPPHVRGELLAGVAQSAQRTGHSDEAAQFVRRILETMPGTPYAAAAQRWTAKPEVMARSSIQCQTCHEPGRLAARTAALAAQ